MRRPWLRRLVAGLLALAPICAPARATPFEATLSLAIDSAIGSLGAVSFVGSGSGTSTMSTVTVPSGIFAGGALIPVAGVASLSAVSIQVSGNLAGEFTKRFVNRLFGDFTLSGAVRLKGSLGAGPSTLVSVPLQTTMHTVVTGGPFAYWRTYHYIGGVPWGDASSYIWVYGSDERTPGGLGQLTLVSPIRIETSLPGTGSLLIVLGALTLNFVPEPGTLVLLGSGVAVLGFLGRSRLRRR
jgi:hypothetical protein